MPLHPRPCSRGRRRAAAAVELALLLPILALLFLGAVDFCRVFYYSAVLSNCARNGALYASNPQDAATSPYPDVTTAAKADAAGWATPPAITTANGTDASGNAYVEVTASYTFNTLISYPGLPSPLNLARTTRMYVEPAFPNNPVQVPPPPPPQPSGSTTSGTSGSTSSGTTSGGGGLLGGLLGL